MNLLASPFARMLAVFAVESLIAKGILKPDDASKAVEDIINVIGFVAMVLTLLIWQWRAHHPAKAHLDVSMPISGETQVQQAQTRRSIGVTFRNLVEKLLLTPKTT